MNYELFLLSPLLLGFNDKFFAVYFPHPFIDVRFVKPLCRIGHTGIFIIRHHIGRLSIVDKHLSLISTRVSFRARKFIKDFYANRIAINPTNHIETTEQQYLLLNPRWRNIFDRNIGKSQNRNIGVLKGRRQNILYCITAIEKTTNNPPCPRNSY